MTIVVVGANSTIGATIVRRVASNATPVLAVYHGSKSRLGSLPSNVELYGPFDIAADDHVRALVQTSSVANGISGLVNLASYSAPEAWNANILHVPKQVVRETFEVDVLGTLSLVSALRANLLPQSSIVLFGSAGAQSSDLDTAIYNPAKIALESLAKHLAKTLAPHVRVNVILPGAIRSEWIDKWQVTEADMRAFKAVRLGQQRLGEPEDIGELVAFLLSDRAGYISAQAIAVDGGSQA